MHAVMRQLADLRTISSDVERELHALKQEHATLDGVIARARKQGRETPRRRFWRGFATGLLVVGLVWGTSLGVASLTVGN